MLAISARLIGKEIVEAKLLAAAPRILEQNRLMIGAMLKEIKATVEAQTPIGPGHFGYHLRDSYVADVRTTGVKTKGVLKSPAQGYWREFGTLSNFHKSGDAGAMRSYVAAIGGFTGQGEPARMTAHRAAGAISRFIKFYYNGLANWWRL